MDSKTAVRQLKRIRKLVEDFGEEPRLAAEGWKEDWQVLIAIILSAQTRDSKTVAVCEKLFGKYKRVEDLAGASIEEIEGMIGSVNYYKTKARNIRETARVISLEGIGESVGASRDDRQQVTGDRKSEHEAEIKSLMRLPGVGRKTANVYLVEVKKVAAIGVDTHVGRIAFKLGWTNSRNPVVVERDLMALFPRRYWGLVNGILVRFGQSVGRSRRREDLVLGKLV